MTNITLSHKNPLATREGDPATLRELMAVELKKYAPDTISKTAMKVRDENDRNRPSITHYTKREFSTKHVDLFAAVAKIYGTLYVTRRMVLAVNNILNQQVTCPSTLNQNDFCRTSIDGLYRLPEWALPKDLVKDIRQQMQQRAIEYRQQKQLEGKKAKAEKALPAPSEEPASEPSKSKKRAKKAKAAKSVEPTTNEPATETLEPVAEEAASTSDNQSAEETLAAAENAATETEESEAQPVE